MRISDWSSDVCSSDLAGVVEAAFVEEEEDTLEPQRLVAPFAVGEREEAGAVRGRRVERARNQDRLDRLVGRARVAVRQEAGGLERPERLVDRLDRQSTRLNSSH